MRADKSRISVEKRVAGIDTYSGSLPVMLAASPGAAAQYTIEADAASGATQSTNVNATTSQSNVNFNF
ncbi:hypothetical protein [Burkholderia territorii]|uniref:hypothetical protein n=1 Tax=Burkholderia territorii TaxID=1503055 RepID=UPI000754BE5C|nr:hypothetical protein [Burkholderia territorii]KWE37230.1 hypothetical protein WT49_10305 [Burkholderia territorii]KWE38269.1 hypothetical protein WT50_19160 [Burkholderia territorii]KWE50108.1 hypothetical protein WT51_13005 [Burkholderia territorii]